MVTDFVGVVWQATDSKPYSKGASQRRVLQFGLRPDTIRTQALHCADYGPASWVSIGLLACLLLDPREGRSELKITEATTRLY